MVSAKKFTVSKALIYLFLIILAFICLYPVLYVLNMSFSSEKHLIIRDVYLWPKGFTFDSYRELFKSSEIWRAYLNTIIYTTLGTFIGLTTTVALSYAVSQKKFKGRSLVIWCVMFTMLFSGGMVPTYILVQGLGLLNTPWAIVLPGAVNAWNMIVARTYFMTIPASIFESAEIDGADEFRKLWFIGLSLAKPIIAVLFIFLVVGFWNTYFTSMIYLNDVKLQPIQNYLQRFLESSSAGNTSGSGGSAITVEKIKYAAMVVTMFPIMAIYPFVQKFFVYGIMVGSLKE